MLQDLDDMREPGQDSVSKEENTKAHSSTNQVFEPLSSANQPILESINILPSIDEHNLKQSDYFDRG
jgi:hypothetical protein